MSAWAALAAILALLAEVSVWTTDQGELVVRRTVSVVQDVTEGGEVPLGKGVIGYTPAHVVHVGTIHYRWIGNLLSDVGHAIAVERDLLTGKNSRFIVFRHKSNAGIIFANLNLCHIMARWGRNAVIQSCEYSVESWVLTSIYEGKRVEYRLSGRDAESNCISDTYPRPICGYGGLIVSLYGDEQREQSGKGDAGGYAGYDIEHTRKRELFAPIGLLSGIVIGLLGFNLNKSGFSRGSVRLLFGGWFGMALGTALVLIWAVP